MKRLGLEDGVGERYTESGDWRHKSYGVGELEAGKWTLVACEKAKRYEDHRKGLFGLVANGGWREQERED